MKIKIKDIESGIVREWTLQEVINYINADRSGKWTDYDESDWVDGWMSWCEGEIYTLISATHEENENTIKHKFPRRCDITGMGMWEGYCFGDGQDYAMDKPSAEKLAKQYGYDTLEEAFEDGAYYFTEWEELDEDEWYESEYQDGRDAVGPFIIGD